MIPPDASVSDYNQYYYQQYKKLYMASFVLSTQMKQLLKIKDELVTKLNKLEKKTEDFSQEMRSSNEDKKKRFRRTADSIQRDYKCSVEKCQKLYGSQGSLHQHIKLKHPELWVEQPDKESGSEYDAEEDEAGEGSDKS